MRQPLDQDKQQQEHPNPLITHCMSWMSNERKRSEGTRGCQPLEQTTVSFSCSFSHSSERKWCWSWFRGKQQNLVASSDQSDVSKKGVPIFRVKHISRPLPFWGNVSLYTSRSLPFSGLFLMSRSHNLSFSFTWLDSWHNNFRTRSLVSFRAIVSSLSSHSYFVSPFNASFSQLPFLWKQVFPPQVTPLSLSLQPNVSAVVVEFGESCLNQ